MKLAVTPFNVSSIKKLASNGADIFILGNEQYANRLVYSFSTIEITDANKVIKELGKELYINCNMIAHNSDLEPLKEYLEFLKTLDVDGIIFGDLGLYMVARKLGMEDKLIYNPETLNTSHFDPAFWDRKGIKGITISREITLDDIELISKNSRVEISLIGHGHLNMFHSRRPLIENYFKYTKEEYEKYLDNRNLKIVEEIRNEAYPIFQDNHGTHIFREKALESFNEVKRLKDSLDVFIIDGIFKDSDYVNEMIKNYNALLNKNGDSRLAEKFSKIYERNHDSGFLYKKTVYDKY